MKRFISTILGIVLLIGSGYGLFNLIKILIDSLKSLPSEVSAALVAGMLTAIVTVISITLGKYYERKLQIDKELREKKIPIYSSFIDFFLNKMMSSEQPLSEEELKAYFRVFTKELMIWGSDEVISRWSAYRINLISMSEGETPEDSRASFIELEELLKAIRKDTGHKNSNLKQGDILKMFINDFK